MPPSVPERSDAELDQQAENAGQAEHQGSCEAGTKAFCTTKNDIGPPLFKFVNALLHDF
jgi:hypothetical protein